MTLLNYRTEEDDITVYRVPVGWIHRIIRHSIADSIPVAVYVPYNKDYF